MSPVRRPAARPLAAVASILAALMILTGCGTPVPSPDPQPKAPETMPVLDKPRIERILNDLGETIDKADEEKDAELLQPRVADPALEIRAAEYSLAKATDGGEDAYSPRTLIADPQVRIVSVSDSWPRTMMVVTQIPDDENVPLLLTLQQKDARSPYKLHHWVRLLPGTEMPPTAVVAAGSEQVPADASGYLMNPKQALQRYADILTNGSDSEYADAFALKDDEFSSAVAQEAENLDTVGEAGTFEHKTTAADSAPLTLATENGGYIVVGELQAKQTFTKTISGSEITISAPQVAALDPEDGKLVYLEDSINAAYETMVAVYVPKKGDDAKATVLGAERVLAGVSRECPRDPDRCS
ncbi:MAG TPA: hypothetical protein VK095_00080 [Beutenbergiaceae bacterium]|nr:hypothetical protein [Beutenbergiaceae bacterium]